MFDMCSFEESVIVFPSGMKLLNKLRRYGFVGGLCCILAAFIETVNIAKCIEYFYIIFCNFLQKISHKKRLLY